MLSLKKIARKPALLAASVVLAAGAITFGAGAASASIPDSDGVIHACYTTSSGALRVIDTGSGGSCYGYETSLTWSATPLQVFTGTASITSGSPGYYQATCSDGGIPVAVYPGINGNYSAPTLLMAGGQPDGIQQPYYGTGSVNYTLICS